MPSTTNTQTVAPPGLLAMSFLSGMTTNITAEVVSCCRMRRNVVVISGYSSGKQNTASTALEPCGEPYKHTDAGLAVLRPHTVSAIAVASRAFRARDAIFELKRLSGLTWEELAALLSVTRRSLHLWAKGGAINTLNERQVRELLVTMRELDRGTARENRALLLASLRDDGDITVGDLLRGREFRKAVALIGRRRGRATPPTSREALWKPEKLSVADRLGTSADRIHTDEGARCRVGEGCVEGYEKIVARGADAAEIERIDRTLSKWRQGDATLDADTFLVHLAHKRTQAFEILEPQDMTVDQSRRGAARTRRPRA